MTSWLVLYEAGITSAAAGVLAYLLLSGRFVVTYRSLIRGLAVALLAFAVVSAAMVAVPGVHPLNGLMGLFVLVPLYAHVRSAVSTDHDKFETAFGRSP